MFFVFCFLFFLRSPMCFLRRVSINCFFFPVYGSYFLGFKVGGVLFSMPLSSQAAITKYQTGWLINNRHVFLTVLEAGNLGSGFQHGLVPIRTLLWVSDCWILTGSSPGREQRDEAGSLMTIRALIPYMRAPLLGPYLILFTTQASPLPINIILKGGDSTYEFGEGAQIFSPLQSYNFIVEN